MAIKLKRINEKFALEATTEEGVVTKIDGSEKIGGVGYGARPMQLLATALGSCSSIDILSILYKQKQDVQDYEVVIHPHRRENELPAIFDKIHVEVIIYGNVDPEKAQKAADLSFQKYCSVSRMIENASEITYEVTVKPAKK